VTAEGRLPQIGALDGLRGVAITLVLVYHLTDWLPGGFLGVDLFFTLSGFLITTILLTGVRERRLDLRAFWAQRARRLLPALYLAVAAVIVLQAVRAPDGLIPGLRAQVAGTLLYVSNWVLIAQGTSYFDQFADPSPLRHTWSLAIEEQFYVAWPLVVALLARWSGGPLLLVRRALAVAVVGALASTVAMAALYDPVDASRAYFGTDTHLAPILVGCAAACVRLLALRHGWSSAPRSATRAVQLFSLGLLGAFVLGAGLADEQGSALYHGGFLVAAMLAAWLVLLVVLRNADASGVLQWRPLRWAGRLSYGIYLAHWIVVVYLTEAVTGLAGLPLAAVQLAVTLAVATLSYRLLEDPIRRRRTGLPAWMQTGLAATAGAGLLVATVTVGGLGAPPALAGGVTQLADALPPPPPPPSTLPAPGPAPPASSLPASSDAPAAAAGGAELAPVAAPPTTPAPTAPPTTAPRNLRLFVVGDSVGFTFAYNWPQHLTPDVTVHGSAALGCRLQPGEQLRAGEPTGNTTGCPSWRTDWPGQMQFFAPDVVLAFLTAWEASDARVDGRDVRLGTPEGEQQLLEVLDTLRQMTTQAGGRLAIVLSPPMAVDGEPRGSIRHPDEQWRITYLNDLYQRYSAQHRAEVGVLDLRATLCPTEPCSYTLDGVEVLPDRVHFDVPGAEVTALTVLPTLRTLANGTG
jgi:peptidoglycan/LPS O-acetylase OafA/YrhL